jgi:tetratricopeptide (TPR) repeat protein
MADSNEQAKRQLFAARTEAFQQARATNLFKTLLLVIGVCAFLALAVYSLSHSRAQYHVRAPFDNKEAHTRIVELEKELQVLKSDLAVVQQPNPFVAAAESVLKFAIAYWALLGFVFALGIAAYAKLKFKIDYFESYRDLATKKMLSEFYRELGDRMMSSTEWEAAESAYRDSLTINPTNIKATFGIAKASVFQPLKGQQFYVPEIVDAKLDYLITNSAQIASKSDYAQLYFLKSINRSEQGDEEASRDWLRKSVETDSRNFAAYLNLGFSYRKAGEIERAIEYYAKAAEIEPNWAVANNNLGSCYLNTAQFAKAVEYLERANNSAALLVTHLELAEAYRYAGRLGDALFMHKLALINLEIKGIENERYSIGHWAIGFMPLQEGDSETIRKSVTIRTFAQKKMRTYHGLAFDRALNEQLSKADEAFNLGRACGEVADYNAFFLNRIESILYFLKPTGKVREWFENKKTELSISPR